MVFKLRSLLFTFLGIIFSAVIFAQGALPPALTANSRTINAFNKLEDSVKAQFERKNLIWPPAEMYVRSFKYDRQLEVWVKGKKSDPFQLFKTYSVCQVSGTTGPKRMEGDYQVPEGFYHIDEFNPNSAFHLSLGLSYPNASDKLLSDQRSPGSAIYIHGNCVSTGCIPITDVPIEELYIIASFVKSKGQEFIPVHVFPIRYSVKKSTDYLANVLKENPGLVHFNENIRPVYDYFESKKLLPLILVNSNGDYVIN